MNLNISFDPENGIGLVQEGLEFVSNSVGEVSKFVSLIKGVKSARDAFFIKKLGVFLEEYSSVNNIISAKVLENFQSAHGVEYFRESLFSAIEGADSTKRSRLYARLLSKCVIGEIPNDEYYSILFVLKNINLQDLEKLQLAISWQRKLNNVTDKEFIEMTKVIEQEIGMRTLIRYQSVALARSANVYGGSRIPFINVTFASMVVKVLD